jgi:hypothetical protein
VQFHRGLLEIYVHVFSSFSELPPEESTFKQYVIAEENELEITVECEISKEQFAEMLNSRFKQLICPFGVAITGTKLFSESNLIYTAKVIANILDPDQSGEVEEGTDEDALRGEMSAKGSGLMIGGGVSEKDEKTCTYISKSPLWNCTSLQLYKKDLRRRRLE